MNKLEGNNLGFELDTKILESKVEKMEKINKTLNDQIKSIEDFQKTKMSLIEFEKKVKCLAFLYTKLFVPNYILFIFLFVVCFFHCFVDEF